MSQPEIKAEKINSPIQLMAAWFVMLILLSGVLLTAASQIKNPIWASDYLIIFATILILIVLASVILMLTKYRPNLQEGKEYAQWLKDQNNYSDGIIQKHSEVKSINRIQFKLNELKEQSTNIEYANLVEHIEDNVLYNVSISNLEKSAEIIRSMREIGINAEIYEKSPISTFEEHQAIWLGSNIPAKIAIPVLKRAIKIWPHLKYISLSSDSAGPEETHYEIYLGGTTLTAREEQLMPWTNDEINNLEVKNLAEFHADIRSKYP